MCGAFKRSRSRVICGWQIKEVLRLFLRPRLEGKLGLITQGEYEWAPFARPKVD